ncbi:MAG: hypothetical protein ACE5HI_01060 [bacterium]
MLKKTFLSFVSVLFVASALFAANPTVTVTKVVTLADVIIYKVTFSTAIASLDTAIIYKDISNAKGWNIDYMGSEENFNNQFVTYTVETSEATADSVRFDVLHQISYVTSPTTSPVVNDDWTTFATDVDTNAISFAKKFSPLSTGRPRKYRMLVIENDANKDATQNITMYVTFPRPKDNRNIF